MLYILSHCLIQECANKLFNICSVRKEELNDLKLSHLQIFPRKIFHAWIIWFCKCWKMRSIKKEEEIPIEFKALKFWKVNQKHFHSTAWWFFPHWNFPIGERRKFWERFSFPNSKMIEWEKGCDERKERTLTARIRKKVQCSRSSRGSEVQLSSFISRWKGNLIRENWMKGK